VLCQRSVAVLSGHAVLLNIAKALAQTVYGIVELAVAVRLPGVQPGN
jgi:hypothetical protein